MVIVVYKLFSLTEANFGKLYFTFSRKLYCCLEAMDQCGISIKIMICVTAKDGASRNFKVNSE